LKQGKAREARDVADEVAAAAAKGQDREVQLRSEMVVAEIAGATSANSAEVTASLRQLDEVARAAAAASFSGLAFEARLRKAELQMDHAERETGRTALLALEHDSSNAGFAAIAKRASSLLLSNHRPGA
jgi:hypothetical protein